MTKFHYVKQLDTTPKHFLNPNAPKKAVGAYKKYWKTGQTIHVFFQGGNERQRNLVKLVTDEIETFVNLKFAYTTDPSISDIRISFVEDNSSWSYEGTDALQISKAAATMNFGWLLQEPNDIGTVRHELFHGIGAVHEHNWGDIEYDKECIYAKYAEIGWSRFDADNNVLNHRHEVVKSEVRDWTGIMHYPMGWDLECILNKEELELPLGFNGEFSKEDKRFWGEVYKFNTAPVTPVEPTEPTEPKGCNEDMYIEALQLIYSNTRSASGQLKKINKGVAEVFGLSTNGVEKQIVKRIESFIKTM